MNRRITAFFMDLRDLQEKHKAYIHVDTTSRPSAKGQILIDLYGNEDEETIELSFYGDLEHLMERQSLKEQGERE